MACPVAPAPANPDDIKASKPSGDMGEVFLSLPFDVEQYPDGMMPMGETIQHSPPNGHPGIDFQWLFPAKITVALEGIVGDITEEIHPVDGEIIYTVRVISGDYGVSYEVYDLHEFNPELKIGDPIAKGQQLGIPQVVHAERRMMHWGFGRARQANGQANPEGVIERYWVDWFCPIPYLLPKEQERLRHIWASVDYEHKDQFPELCNGPYKNYE